MTIPTATEILALLMQAKPRPTSEAPRDARGIYGLFDHTGTFRYIGSTSSAAETFYKRIHQRHRTGSESTSHYFSHMYNTGRMWRLRNDPATKSDGDIAKALRNAFIARHCGCTWVTLPDHADIAALEAQVISLAPPEMVAWNRRGMAVYEEPVDLVDALIAELRLSPVERAALGRQRQRQSGGIPISDANAPRQSKKNEIPAGLPPLPEGPFRFFALDVETANPDRDSICQVGVACVRPDDRIETWVTLVDPRTETWTFSYLHGITRAMVGGAPTIGTVIDTLDKLLTGRTVYQHSGFDRSAIRTACLHLDRAEPEWSWQNSVSVARAAWPELKGNGGHGLASLKAHLGLTFEHHDAGEDARAAAQVVLLAERGARINLKDLDVLDESDIGPLPSRKVLSGAGSIGRSVLSQGNLNNNHFYLRGFLTAFPADVIGGPNRDTAAPRTLQICWDGTPPVRTDIDGKKAILRDRAWVRRFFERHNPRAGDIVEVSETAPYCYRVALIRT